MSAKKKLFKDVMVKEFKRHTSVLVKHVDKKTDEVKRHMSFLVENTNKKAEEVKRHMSFLVEHTDKKIELVAEQHGSIIRKLEEHDERFDQVDQRLDRVEMGVLHNTHRIDHLHRKFDTRLEDHEQRITTLEHGTNN